MCSSASALPLHAGRSALARPLGEDLGLPAASCFPERELPAILNDQAWVRDAGLPVRWYLNPMDISLTDAGRDREPAAGRPAAGGAAGAGLHGSAAEPLGGG